MKDEKSITFIIGTKYKIQNIIETQNILKSYKYLSIVKFVNIANR